MEQPVVPNAAKTSNKRKAENAHWIWQHGGPGDIHLNCFSEITGTRARLEMTEKWMGSENTETLYGSLSRTMVLRENSPNLFILSVNSWLFFATQ